MKTLITGMNGTVAPALAAELRKHNHSITAWDRAAIPTDDLAAARAFIHTERPDVFCHIATGSPDWAAHVARVCAEAGIKFLFTSSVSVYANAQIGPFTVDMVPEPDDDYGRYKLTCEQRIRAANADAIIVRLGWQIGKGRGGNQMVDYLYRTAEQEGRIRASAAQFPACSFLADTAAALHYLLQHAQPGLYHLDANPSLSFYEIAAALNRFFGEPWLVEPGSEPVLNNRMVDERVAVRPLTATLSAR